ncbi:MAG: response regulator [Nitrospinae bacterium]|nr:response regulator [Nitrospinota bacterium]
MQEQNPKHTILVIDDEENIRNVLETVFTGKGYGVVKTANGFEAIKAVEGGGVDLAVIDIKMPGMDGMELLSRIKDHSAEFPVVIMTGFADVETAAKALKAGASDFLAKPFGAQEVYHSVSRLLELRKVREENRKILPFFKFTMDAEIPTRTDYVNGVIHYITEHLKEIELCDSSQLSNLVIALYEAIVNGMRHGNGNDPGKKVRVRAEIGYNEARFTVTDQGEGFAIDDIANPTAPKNLYKSSGRGIYLMRHFMDEVSYNDQGNEVTLVKRRKGGAPPAPGNA